MAFNLLDLFGPAATNRLVNPAPIGPQPQNMLVSRNIPQDQQISPSFPIAAPAIDPQMTAAVQSPAPQSMPSTQVAQAQQPQSFGDRYKGFWASDAGSKLGDMFTGWAMGATPQQSIALGAAQVSQGSKGRKAVNQTVDWLKSRGLGDTEAAFLAGNPDGLADYLKNVYAQQRNQGLLNVGKGSALYDPVSKQWITPPEGTAGGTEYGLAPIYGTDANGNTVIGQLAKDGTFQQTQLTPGFVPTPGVSNTDLGTSVITRNNKTGQIIDTQNKDVQGEAFQKKVGQDTGEQAANKVAAGSSLGSTLSSLDRLDAAANELVQDPDLGRVTGWAGMLPNVPGGKGASVQARLNTLKSQIGFSVLQAMRDASKTGGALGAISDKENDLLQNNLAALDQVQSEADLKTQLGRIRNYVAGAKTRLSGAYQQMYGQPYQAPGTTPAASSNIDDLLKKYGGQ